MGWEGRAVSEREWRRGGSLFAAVWRQLAGISSGPHCVVAGEEGAQGPAASGDKVVNA